VEQGGGRPERRTADTRCTLTTTPMAAGGRRTSASPPAAVCARSSIRPAFAAPRSPAVSPTSSTVWFRWVIVAEGARSENLLRDIGTCWSPWRWLRDENSSTWASGPGWHRARPGVGDVDQPDTASRTRLDVLHPIPAQPLVTVEPRGGSRTGPLSRRSGGRQISIRRRAAQTANRVRRPTAASRQPT
jgi:hypothetical protein